MCGSFLSKSRTYYAKELPVCQRVFPFLLQKTQIFRFQKL